MGFGGHVNSEIKIRSTLVAILTARGAANPEALATTHFAAAKAAFDAAWTAAFDGEYETESNQVSVSGNAAVAAVTAFANNIEL